MDKSREDEVEEILRREIEEATRYNRERRDRGKSIQDKVSHLLNPDAYMMGWNV
jgi:hypothetical protein